MELYDNLVRLFHQGGIAVMTSIMLVCALALAIIFERSFRYWLRYDTSNSSGLIAAVQTMVMSNSIENAIRLCKSAQPRLLPFVLAEGLKRANDSAEEVENAIHSATLSVLPKVTKALPFLGTAANVATLLGLLGTIFGLIKSFGAAASATGAEKQTILAEGISEALTATSFGLGTALMCLLAHGLLTMKQQTIIADITQGAAKLTDLLYTRRAKAKHGEL